VLLIRSGRAHWVKTKNPAAPAVKRESEIGAKTDDGEAKNTEPMHPLSRYRLGLRGAYPSSMGWRECMRLRRGRKVVSILQSYTRNRGARSRWYKRPPGRVSSGPA